MFLMIVIHPNFNVFMYLIAVFRGIEKLISRTSQTSCCLDQVVSPRDTFLACFFHSITLDISTQTRAKASKFTCIDCSLSDLLHPYGPTWFLISFFSCILFPLGALKCCIIQCILTKETERNLPTTSLSSDYRELPFFRFFSADHFQVWSQNDTYLFALKCLFI